MEADSTTNDSFDKFYNDLITSLSINKILVPRSISENSDGELYQGSIGGKHDYSSGSISNDSMYLVRGSKNRNVKIYSLTTHQIIGIIRGFEDAVISTSISHDKSMLLTATMDNSVNVFNLATHAKMATLQHNCKAKIKIVRFSPNALSIILVFTGGIIMFWQTSTFKKMKETTVSPSGIQALECSPNSAFAMAAADNKLIYVFSLDNFKLSHKIKAFEAAVISLTFTIDGKFMIAGTADKKIKFFCGRNYQDFAYSFEHYGPVNQVATSFDGQYLAASSNKLLIIYTFESDGLTISKQENLMEDKICNLFFAVDRATLICSFSNDKIESLDVDTGETIFQIEGSSHHLPIVTTLATHDSKNLVSATELGDIKAWSLDNFMFVNNFEDETPQTNDVYTLCISPNSKFIACAPRKEFNDIKIWSIESKKLIKTITIQEGVEDIFFAPDSKFLLCSAVGPNFWICDLDTLEKSSISKKMEANIICMNTSKRSADMKFLVAATTDKNLVIWSIPNLDIVTTLQEETPTLYRDVVVSLNNKWAITSSETKMINIWSLEDFRLMRSLQGHTDHILSICFSPDSNYIISCSRNDKVLIWSTFYSDTFLFVLEGETRTINCVTITQDSKYILGGSDDSSINVWRLDSNLPKTHIETSEPVHYYAITPDSNLLILVLPTSLQVWDMNNNYHLLELKEILATPITSVTFTPNSQKMLLASTQSTDVLIYNLRNFRSVGILDGSMLNLQGIFSVIVSPDCKFAITADQNQNIYKWDLSRLKMMEDIKIRNDIQHAVENTVCISPDSYYLLTAWGQGFVRMWEFDTFKEEAFFQIHDNPIIHLMVTNNNEFIISAAKNDRIIKITSMDTLHEVDRIDYPHYHPVQFMSMDSKSMHMIGTLEDNSIRVWSLQAFQQVEVVATSGQGPACCLSPNSKFLVMQDLAQTKTTIFPFLSDDFQTYPFILNLIKDYFHAPSREARDSILHSLIVIITKHRKYYQLVLNPIFSIITLLLNEELTTSVVLSQYLTPYKLFENYEALTVVIMNNRAESLKTYLGLLETYRKRHGFYPYFDQNFIGLLLTKYPHLINSLEMKEFIMKNLFYYVKTMKGELEDGDTDAFKLTFLNFGPKDIRDQMVLVDKHCNQMLKRSPVNINTFDCYISIIPLDFSNGSEFSRKFFSNISIFSQFELETRLSKLINYKWKKIYGFQVFMTLLFWVYNFMLYYYLGFSMGTEWMGIVLLLISTFFILCEVKFMLTEGLKFFKERYQIFVLTLHLIALWTVAIIQYNGGPVEFRAVNVLRMLSVVLVSLRGIWMMRVFQNARYMVTMLYQVMMRVLNFFVIFFYIIFIFESIWRVLPSVIDSAEPDNSLGDSLIETFNVAFMSYDTSTYGFYQWVVFTLAILVLNFLMLNYLVSLICIFYEEIAENKVITNIQELIVMINETDNIYSGMQSLKCWSKRRRKKVADQNANGEKEGIGLHYLTMISREEVKQETDKYNVSVADFYLGYQCTSGCRHHGDRQKPGSLFNRHFAGPDFGHHRDQADG